MHYESFKTAIHLTGMNLLRHGQRVDASHWQGVATKGRPDLTTVEVRDVAFTVPMPVPKPEECQMEQPIFMLRDEIQPNLPWADLEFEERVGRQPRNPHASLEYWPWWRGQTEATMYEGKFTHTYSERYWPKQAGDRGMFKTVPPGQGIRYEMGDLDDVVQLLRNWPGTRQAYLPIFFPEDTGNLHEGRIPCTLGYHFLQRDGYLHMTYLIRSCDFVRHFRDDLYLSARLLLWVIKELDEDLTPGNFTFVCPSLHYHRGDEHHVKK
jgi:hypothetical protein